MNSAVKKMTLRQALKMKQAGEQMSWITSYSAPQASFAEAAGIDMVLAGDSGAMCLLGYSDTVPIVMDEILTYTKAVRRGAPNTFLVGDMPFGSYQVSPEQAVMNAVRFCKEAGCDAIKLEGGVRIKKQIQAITDAGILVFGHTGLTPQSSGALGGGHLAQGRTVKSAREVITDSFAAAEAGCHFLLLEAVPPEVTKFIRDQLDIPVYSIGAGTGADGQLLIISDVVGEFQAFTPKFVKKYTNVAEVITNAIKEYKEEVKSLKFPADEHCYHIIKSEEAGIMKLFEEMKLK